MTITIAQDSTMNETTECTNNVNLIEVLQKQQSQIDDLKKQLETSTTNHKRYEGYYNSKCEELSKLNEQLEEVHTFIDHLEPVSPRQTEAENSWERKKLSLITRFAIYLAKTK